MRSPVFSLLALLTPLAAQETSWLTDFEAAAAAAKQNEKAILANFTDSDDTTWCAKLKKEVFDTPEFQKWAAENVVLLTIDSPKKTALSAEQKAHNDALVQKYRVTLFPTVLFLDSAGKATGKLGYKPGGPAVWTEAATEQIHGKAPVETDAEVGWITAYDDALARAKKEKKFVIANFTGSDWCGWCIKLKDEVFSKDEFKEWAKDNAVLLELDFPQRKKLAADLQKQNEKLRDEHRIRGYPTIVFLDSKGKDIGRSGYVKGGPEAWIAAAEKATGVKSKKTRKAQ